MQETILPSWIMPDAFSKQHESKEQIVSTFVATVCAFYNINLTPKELEFLMFLILRDKGLVGLGRQQYMEKYHTSKARVDNIVSNLKKKYILIGERDKCRIHPNIAIKFTDNNYIFQFRCRRITKTTGVIQ